MKKVLLFVLSLKIGGSEKACVRLANSLCDRYDITIYTYFGGGELEQELDSRIHLKTVFPRFVRGFARIAYLPSQMAYRLFIKGKYDYEIAVGDGLESHVISGSPNKNKYSWIHINLGKMGTHRNSKTIERFQQYKTIICVSEYNKRCFISEMGFKEKIKVAYTPIDREEIEAKAKSIADIKKKHTLSLVAVGRLEEVKGFDRLIRAVNQLPEYEFELHIYGAGTQQEYLDSLIKEYSLEDKVFLEGAVKNPYPYIANASALICSSVEESFGFSVLEAMVLKTPVLSTKCGGVEEIITAPEYGMLCENSEEGMKNCIEDFILGKHTINLEVAYNRTSAFDVAACTENFQRILEDE